MFVLLTQLNICTPMLENKMYICFIETYESNCYGGVCILLFEQTVCSIDNNQWRDNTVRDVNR